MPLVMKQGVMLVGWGGGRQCIIWDVNADKSHMYK